MNTVEREMLKDASMQNALQRIMEESGTPFALAAEKASLRSSLILCVGVLIAALPALLHLFFLSSFMLLGVLVYLIITPPRGKPLLLAPCLIAGALLGAWYPLFFLDNIIAVIVMLALITLVCRLKAAHFTLNLSDKGLLAPAMILITAIALWHIVLKGDQAFLIVLPIIVAIALLPFVITFIPEAFKAEKQPASVTACIDLASANPDEPIMNLILSSSSGESKIDPADIKKRRVLATIGQILAAAILLTGALTAENIRTSVTEPPADKYANTVRQTYDTADFEFEFELTDGGAVLKLCKATGNEPLTCTVPETWQDQPVTEIGEAAFLGFEHLEKVVLPDTVREIGNSAFHGCTSLREINMPSGLEKIHAYAFWDCQSLKEIALPDTLTSLGAYAFSGCAFETVQIPNGIIELHYGTFSGCKSLQTVLLPEGLEKIGDGCFYRCTQLTDIEIPDSVRSLGEYCFQGCYALTSIRIPDGVDRIKPYTFAETGLTSITVPEGVYKISSHAFYQCKHLETVRLPFSLRTIGSSAFREGRRMDVHKSLRINVSSNAFKSTNASIHNDVTLFSAFSKAEP